MPEESGAVPPGNCVAANWKYTYLPWGGVDLRHQRSIVVIWAWYFVSEQGEGRGRHELLGTACDVTSILPAIWTAGRATAHIGPDIIRQRAVAQANPIVIWIGDVVYGRARTNDQAAGWYTAAILKEMTKRYASFERCRVSGAKLCYHTTFNQGDFTFKNIDQLIF